MYVHMAYIVGMFTVYIGLAIVSIISYRGMRNAREENAFSEYLLRLGSEREKSFIKKHKLELETFKQKIRGNHIAYKALLEKWDRLLADYGNLTDKYKKLKQNYDKLEEMSMKVIVRPLEEMLKQELNKRKANKEKENVAVDPSA